MFCPYCRNPDSRVIDSRTADDGAAIRRRRSCPGCGRRFTTQETVILMVSKRSGVTAQPASPQRRAVVAPAASLPEPPRAAICSRWPAARRRWPGPRWPGSILSLTRAAIRSPDATGGGPARPRTVPAAPGHAAGTCVRARPGPQYLVVTSV